MAGAHHSRDEGVRRGQVLARQIHDGRPREAALRRLPIEGRDSRGASVLAAAVGSGGRGPHDRRRAHRRGRGGEPNEGVPGDPHARDGEAHHAQGALAARQGEPRGVGAEPHADLRREAHGRLPREHLLVPDQGRHPGGQIETHRHARRALICGGHRRALEVTPSLHQGAWHRQAVARASRRDRVYAGVGRVPRRGRVHQGAQPPLRPVARRPRLLGKRRRRRQLPAALQGPWAGLERG
mmetsp:Transcript_63341/g.159746  ORF Transcript_63341/g.159746 Transcript_63341/m.159746 type:complete len:239 (+) Transcript_63341:724-1440(+)